MEVKVLVKVYMSWVFLVIISIIGNSSALGYLSGKDFALLRERAKRKEGHSQYYA